MSTIVTQLADIVLNRQPEVEEWFQQQYSKSQPFFYSSVDLRHSGHKIVPVDTNLFPAGFNLLSANAKQRCVNEIKHYIKTRIPNAKQLLLVPENHTRNRYYLENVAVLKRLLEDSGLIVRVGGLAVEETTIAHSASDIPLTIEPIRREGEQVYLEEGKFVPDVVLVNNDLSSGAPEILQDIEPCVIPPVGMGWYRRRKTHHFDTYAEVARRFSQHFGLDDWLISGVFYKCGSINFKEKTGLECTALGVEKVLHKVRQKYEQYGIEDEPYVFVKADSGTYGMGIMTLHSGDELYEMNKKDRNKMNKIKEGVVNSEVIIQEGIPTIDEVNGKPAEPMVYLINGVATGCTYRVNESRDKYSNLNSSGMTFNNACETDQETSDVRNIHDICPAQGLVARLATLAAARECYEPSWNI